MLAVGTNIASQVAGGGGLTWDLEHYSLDDRAPTFNIPLPTS